MKILSIKFYLSSSPKPNKCVLQFIKTSESLEHLQLGNVSFFGEFVRLPWVARSTQLKTKTFKVCQLTGETYKG